MAGTGPPGDRQGPGDGFVTQAFRPVLFATLEKNRPEGLRYSFNIIDHSFHNQVHAHRIVALGNDDVRKTLARLHELQMHGPHRGQVLIHHGMRRTPALHDVAAQTADETQVGVGIHEDLQVHQGAQLGPLENQNALHHDDRLGLHAHGLGLAIVNGKIVVGTLDSLPGLEGLQVLDEQAGFQGIGMVVVNLAAVVQGKMGEVAIVIVVLEIDDAIAKRFEDFFGYGGLARTGAAADSDDQSLRSSRARPSSKPKCSRPPTGPGRRSFR